MGNAIGTPNRPGLLLKLVHHVQTVVGNQIGPHGCQLLVVGVLLQASFHHVLDSLLQDQDLGDPVELAALVDQRSQIDEKIDKSRQDGPGQEDNYLNHIEILGKI